MCDAKPSVSELILAAVFNLQKNNGLSGKEIAYYVAKKRAVAIAEIEDDIMYALKKATEHGIFSERRGLFRIEPCYDDKLKKGLMKRSAS